MPYDSNLVASAFFMMIDFVVMTCIIMHCRTDMHLN